MCTVYLTCKSYNKQRQSFRLKCDLKVSLDPPSRYETKYAWVATLTLLILTIRLKKRCFYLFVYFLGW